LIRIDAPYQRARFRVNHQAGERTAASASPDLGRQRVLLAFFFFCAFLGACASRPKTVPPAIKFVRVPPAAEGSPDKLDVIQGRVSGALPGQRIVLYTKTGAWWLQPIANEPFTTINSDSTWINFTHVGSDYAAMLVVPGYDPPLTFSNLPAIGSGIAAVTSAKGANSAASISPSVFFSGYEWRIRNAPSDRGGWNDYDPSNAWVDSNGALHLRISKIRGEWTCAEVTLTRSLGYGTYTLFVRGISQLQPSVVFSSFTWDYAGSDPNHREMDFEVSRWGDPAVKNAQYEIQPFYVAENVFRFALPPGVFTNSLRWESGRATFRTVAGARLDPNSNLRPIAEHIFTSGVPVPAVESTRISLYIYRPAQDPLQKGAEVVIDKFEYLP
jgi:hypothetical protein